MESHYPIRATDHAPVIIRNVSRCVTRWGRYGILFGGIFGFAIGAAFVSIPFTSDILAFGVVGTLIIIALEGAVIAGAFSAMAAALYGSDEAARTALSRPITTINSRGPRIAR